MFKNVPKSFVIVNFTAKLDFEAESSAGFRLIIVEDLPPKPSCDFIIKDVDIWFGWLDVHHTPDEHIKVRMRVGIHEKYERYNNREDLNAISKTTLDALGFASDETYEIRLIVEKSISAHSQCWDRWGRSDRIVD